MKKKSVLLLVGIIVCLAAFPQSFVGYGYDNYSGVNGVLLNPGTLADGKYKVNVNIFSVSALAGNNAFEIDRSRLLGLHFSNMAEGNGYYKSSNTDYKYLYTNADLLGPSATISLDSRDAIGIITRMRVIGNEYNLSNPLFQLIGNANSDFYNTDIINRSLQTKVNAFAEAGLSYGRVVSRKAHSELKLGITAKYIAGLGYASLSSGQMLVNIDPSNTINKLNADLTTLYSPNLDNLGNGGFSNAFNKKSGNGWGLDLGMIYEWKPDATDYRLRLGFSITDLGSIKYANSPNGQTYSMNVDGHNTSELSKQSGETFNQYLTRLQTEGLILAQGKSASSVNVKLPTALHFNADYRVYKHLFINGDILVNMIATTNLLTPNYVTTFTVTPRLEKKWVSVYSPVSYNAQNQLAWGAGVRFGPLFVGSGTVLSSLLKSRIQTADVHVGLTIPIFQSRHSKDKDKQYSKADTVYRNKNLTHDRDGDGVVDEKDECPDSPGPIALIGCPDRDGDGVPDIKDKCPDVKGSPNFQGCPAPDSDGDSVNDDEDKCPLVKGLVSNHGCPPISPEVIKNVNHAADRIFFVRAKAVIQPDCYPELDRVLKILKADSTLHLHIEGHTDSEGTDARNQSLSNRRARSVLGYLEANGIPARRMDTRAYGSKKPLASNETPEGMARNRRVEMVLTNYQKE
jgi:outer membrane protein OmpA-like peptidoglycan-associated protein